MEKILSISLSWWGREYNYRPPADQAKGRRPDATQSLADSSQVLCLERPVAVSLYPGSYKEGVIFDSPDNHK